MEFVDKNLTKNDIREALNAARTALEIYRKDYKDKTYRLKANKRTVDLIIRPMTLNSLLGIDKRINDTYLELIGTKKSKYDEWLEKFVDASEFLEYMILEKGEYPILSFSKIKFKSEAFCKLALKIKTPFLFKRDFSGYDIDHIGVFEGESIISLKLVHESGNEDSLIYIPKELYVYDKTQEEYNMDDFFDYLVLDYTKIKKKDITREEIIYQEEEKQKVMQKISIFRQQ